MSNIAALISVGTGGVLIILVIVGTIRLIKKTKKYNPNYDLDDIESFFDPDDD